MSHPPPKPNKDKLAKIKKAFNSLTLAVCKSSLAMDAAITKINKCADMCNHDSINTATKEVNITVKNALTSDSIQRKNTFLISAQGEAKDSAIIKTKNVNPSQTH